MARLGHVSAVLPAFHLQFAWDAVAWNFAKTLNYRGQYGAITDAE